MSTAQKSDKGKDPSAGSTVPSWLGGDTANPDLEPVFAELVDALQMSEDDVEEDAPAGS